MREGRFAKGERVADRDMPDRRGIVLGLHRTIMGGGRYIVVRWDDEQFAVYMRASQVMQVANG